MKCNKSFPIEGKWGGIERARGGPVDVDGGSSKPDGTKGCSCFLGGVIELNVIVVVAVVDTRTLPPSRFLSPPPLKTLPVPVRYFIFLFICVLFATDDMRVYSPERRRRVANC